MAEYSREASFIERYIIARAHTFSKEREREEVWECLLTAKSVFKQIGYVTTTEADYGQWAGQPVPNSANNNASVIKFPVIPVVSSPSNTGILQRWWGKK